jgi:hypothetical protein
VAHGGERPGCVAAALLLADADVGLHHSVTKGGALIEDMRLHESHSRSCRRFLRPGCTVTPICLDRGSAFQIDSCAEDFMRKGVQKHESVVERLSHWRGLTNGLGSPP